MRFAQAFILFLLNTAALFGQQTRPSDSAQVSSLLNQLANHSVNAANVLDPQLDAKERKQNLDYFRDPSYQLVFIPTGEIKFQPNSQAVAPVRIHFKNLNSELDASVDVRFVQRSGTWYFADYNFLGWPAFLIILLIVGMTIAVSWTTVVLILRYMLERQGKFKGANFIKIFVPIFWPKLFSETR